MIPIITCLPGRFQRDGFCVGLVTATHNHRREHGKKNRLKEMGCKSSRFSEMFSPHLLTLKAFHAKV